MVEHINGFDIEATWRQSGDIYTPMLIAWDAKEDRMVKSISGELVSSSKRAEADASLMLEAVSGFNRESGFFWH